MKTHRFVTRTTATTAAVVLAALAIAGCGDDDSLSREQFIDQANAICAAGNERIASAAPAGDDGQPPSLAEGERFLEVLVAEGNRQIEEIDALAAPDDLSAEVDDILADARAVFSEVEEAGAEAFLADTGDPFADVNERLVAIGLTDCG